MGRKPLRSRVTTAALLVSPAIVVFVAPGAAQAQEPKTPACTAEVVEPQAKLTEGGEAEKITDTMTVSCEGLATEGNYRLVSTQQAYVETEDGKTPASRVDTDEVAVRTDDTGKFTTTFVQQMNTPSGPVAQGAKVAVTWTLVPQVGNTQVVEGQDVSDGFVSEG